MKLTFKQYLESKQKLVEAVDSIPTAVLEYEVKTYCSFHAGDSKEECTTIALKPKQLIVIDWLYEDAHNPTPQSISFVDNPHVHENDTFTTFWNPSKLQRWLARHTKQRD